MGLKKKVNLFNEMHIETSRMSEIKDRRIICLADRGLFADHLMEEQSSASI